jgi:ribonuclease E
MKRMLIDASHREETRVVVLDGTKVEEFDFEAASKRPLKGNIYLAKVTRVEPSLQAAFVEYGGNRQGFLAFNEIHPDYYQIPVADRQALLEDQQREARRRAEEEGFEAVETGTAVVSDEELEAEEEAEASNPAPAEVPSENGGETIEHALDETARSDHYEDVFDNKGGKAPVRAGDEDEEDDEEDVAESEVESGFDTAQADLGAANGEQAHHDHGDHEHSDHEHDDQPDSPLHALAEEEVEDGIVDQQAISEAGDAPHVTPHGEEHEHHHSDEPSHIVDAQTESDQGIVDEQAAAEPSMDGETPGHTESGETSSQPLRNNSQRSAQRFVRRKHYKIQEVIKRRQIMLVQVVKEERGNKGAALTTYLSLAGRYCVLMPNTPRGGGISRKITNANDRKRLKAAAAALDLPEGMGLIIRTAGESRSKLEIKRDYEYLLRMWDQIRELTLESNAPACVYEEGDLIKRVIRDLYTKDVEEVIVEGDEGYRNAKDFMRMLMPSHAKNVKQYKDTVPLFQRQHIEAQLDSMFQPTVTLKSGGYIVINQTEALVAIDVNSGRATREHSIEETAHKTNLEAADEVGRQLRLRDLAGLIVIDFIDMEDSRNDRHVEKRLRDAVKNDRARVQIGKISQFGLMEMSRQRLRAGVVAGSTITCPHCGGQGIVRSVESTALRVLRGIEEEGQKGRSAAISVKVTPDVAIYAFNHKRQEIARLEVEYGMTIAFEPDATILTGNFDVIRTQTRTPDERPRPSVSIESGLSDPLADSADYIEEEEIVEDDIEDEEEENDAEEREEASAPSEEGQSQQQPRGENREGGDRKRRRRRRGRDRDRPATIQEPIPPSPALQTEQAEADSDDDGPDDGTQEHDGAPQSGVQPNGQPGDGPRKRRRRRRGRRGRRDGETPFNAQNGTGEHGAGEHSTGESSTSEAPPAPVTPNSESAPSWSLSGTQSEPAKSPEPQAASDAPAQPVRKGWWQRAFASKD